MRQGRLFKGPGIISRRPPQPPLDPALLCPLCLSPDAMSSYISRWQTGHPLVCDCGELRGLPNLCLSQAWSSLTKMTTTKIVIKSMK